MNFNMVDKVSWFILLAGFIGFAYSEEAKSFTYACPKCEYESSKQEFCPKHKVELWKSEIVYQCSKCGKEYEKAGKCHEKELERMIVIFSSDFSNKEELKKFNIESGEWTISDGKLHHEADDSVDAMIWIKNLELFGDWEIEADFYRITDEFIGGFAYLAQETFANRQGEETYLTDFLFFPGHEHHEKGRWSNNQKILEITEDSIEMPNIDGKLNLKVRKEGETYKNFFDKKLELEVDNDEYTNGAVGIFCYNYNYKKNNSPLEHTIDNVKIKRIAK